MRFLKFPVYFFACAFMCLMCLGASNTTENGGCSFFKKAEAEIATVVTNDINNNCSTITLGIFNGLTALGKQNATDAKLTSNALSQAAANALATFSGTALPLGNDAKAILNGFGSKLPASATGIATMISGAITTFISIPSASTAVSAATATTVCNLCNEIIAACNQYNASISSGS